MANEVITIKLDDNFKKDVQQAVRDIMILEFGALWEEYCFENMVSPNIKIGFLDYLNKEVDSLD